MLWLKTPIQPYHNMKFNSQRKFAETSWTYFELFVWLIISGSKVGHCKSFLSKLLSKPREVCRHHASLIRHTRFSLLMALCVTCPLALCTDVCMQPWFIIRPPWQLSLQVLSGGVWIWTWDIYYHNKHTRQVTWIKKLNMQVSKFLFPNIFWKLPQPRLTITTSYGCCCPYYLLSSLKILGN